MVETRSHYQVLGVPPGASRTEIRRAHRRLVQVLHPDRHVEASAGERRLAERRMREINLAWHVLSDDRRRADYDRGLRRPGGAAGGRGTPSTSRTAPTGATAGATRPGPPFTAAGATGARTDPRTRPRARHAAPDGRPGYPVGPATSFLLRRGPVLVAVVVAVGLLLVTAYAGTESARSGVREVSGVQECVLLGEGSSGRFIDCSLPNDGRVVAEVAAALDCPEGTRYALVDTRFVCLPRADG